ncbi:MAG: hypothetical protein ABW182_08105 [Sphingomonas sp.]
MISAVDPSDSARPAEPAVGQTGDPLARAFGWLSVAVGLAERAAPGAVGRALGLDVRRAPVRASGLREILDESSLVQAGRQIALGGRVASDLLDMAEVAPVLLARDGARGDAAIALVALGGIALLDALAYLDRLSD